MDHTKKLLLLVTCKGQFSICPPYIRRELYIPQDSRLFTQSSANIKTVINPRHYYLCANSIAVYHSTLCLLCSRSKDCTMPRCSISSVLHPNLQAEMHCCAYVLNSQMQLKTFLVVQFCRYNYQVEDDIVFMRENRQRACFLAESNHTKQGVQPTSV